MLNGRCFIEPKSGWVIASPCGLVRNSFPYSDWAETEVSLLSKPSIPRFAWQAARARQHHASLISLRTPWEDNYFHFFNEILASIRMLDELRIPPAVPILVSSSVWDRGYFQEALAAGVFGDRPVVAQPKDVVISTDQVYLLKRRTGDPRDFAYFLDRLPASPPRNEPARRLFLTRSAAYGRTLTNEDEVLTACARYGFTAVDADGMGLGEQAALFASASHVIGVHSAGLVNVMFARGRPLSLLEILPPGNFPVGFNAVDAQNTDFQFLCEAFGFAYRSIQGEAPGAYYDRALNFAVDPIVVERAIQLSLNSTCMDPTPRVTAPDPQHA